MSLVLSVHVFHFHSFRLSLMQPTVKSATQFLEKLLRSLSLCNLEFGLLFQCIEITSFFHIVLAKPRHVKSLGQKQKKQRHKNLSLLRDRSKGFFQSTYIYK